MRRKMSAFGHEFCGGTPFLCLSLQRSLTLTCFFLIVMRSDQEEGRGKKTRDGGKSGSFSPLSQERKKFKTLLSLERRREEGGKKVWEKTRRRFHFASSILGQQKNRSKHDSVSSSLLLFSLRCKPHRQLERHIISASEGFQRLRKTNTGRNRHENRNKTMASSVPPTSSQPPPRDEPASLLDLPAHVLSTHVLPRLPASAVGRFACTCRLARDAAGEDERLWRLLCARRLERWCPGAADVPPEEWKLPPPRRRRRHRQQQSAPRADGEREETRREEHRGFDSETSDDEEYEQEGDEEGSKESAPPPPPPPPSYRELYCRLLGWGVPGAMLGPVAASADAALGLALQSEDERGDPPPNLSSSSSSSSSSRRAQDPLYWRETRRETAARRPLGSLLSFEPDPRTGSVVGYALSALLEMSAGFLRTPLFEFVPSRRVGRRPRQRCLRFPQQAGDYLARARRDDTAAAAAAPSARRRRTRRHFEPHRARFSLLWETPRQEEEEGGENPDCRDAFDLACQASLEAEAMRGVESEGEGEGEGGAEGLRFFSGLSLSSSRSSPSSSSSSASPPFPRRPAVLLGPCEAWCRQTYEEVACRTAAFVDSMQLPLPRGPPQRREQQQQPGGGGGGGEADEEEEEEEEEEGEVGGESEEDDGAHFSRGVAPAVPGIGRAAPPLDRLGDGCCGTARGTAGGGRGGVSALPRLSRTRTFAELLGVMGNLDMTTVGRSEGEEEGETVSYTPMEGLGLVPPPPLPPPRGEIAGAGLRAGGDKVEQGTGNTEAAPSHSSSSSSSSPAQSQLEGVWKGDYGAHGVEVVRISRFAGPAEVDSVPPVPGSGQFEEVGGRRGRDASLLAAIKLSGDTNVPAGAVSFALGTSPLDCAAGEDYLTFAGGLSLNGGGDAELREVIARSARIIFGFGGGLADFDLLRLSDRANGGLGAPLSLPAGWHCEHELETADPTPLSVRGHWPAAALVALRGFRRPATAPAQVVSVSRDCFFVAWGGGMRKLSLFTRVYRSEMEWAGPEGAR